MPKSFKSDREPWIILPEGDNLFDRSIREGALQCAHERGYSKVTFLDEGELVQRFTAGRAKRDFGEKYAFIQHLRDDRLLRLVRRHDIPAVLLGEDNVSRWKKLLGGRATVCSIDNESIGVQGANYFHDRGHYASFVYADYHAGARVDWWTENRWTGFASQLKALGDPSPIRYRFNEFDPESDRGGFAAFLRNLPHPVAVLACNDRIGARALGAAIAGGLDVPRDVAVLGVDNEAAVCENLPVSMSSIDVDQRRLGRVAMEVLLSMIKRGTRRNRMILCPPLRVIERVSTRLAGYSDAAVARAVAYIDGCPGRATVDGVIAASGLCRSAIFPRFKRATGRTVGEMIRMHALKEVEKRILDGRLPLGEIAGEVGFASAESLCAFFRKEHGMSMREWRQRKRPSG